MNELRNDKNLQEAVSRREQKLPPMPADLNERLMQCLGDQPPSATKQKRLWLYAAVAIAASIALFIVFNFGKEQSLQKPLVAQQIEKQNPQQPTPAVSEPVKEPEPVAAEAQPAQKSVKRQRKVVKLVELIPASEAESANDTDPFVAMAAQVEDIRQRSQCLKQEIDLLMEH